MLFMSFHPFFVMISAVDTTHIGETGPPSLPEAGMASEALKVEEISIVNK